MSLGTSGTGTAAGGDDRTASATDRARSQTERAEDVVSRAGERAGRWAATVAARVREEAEDIWADAQSVRHGRGG